MSGQECKNNRDPNISYCVNCVLDLLEEKFNAWSKKNCGVVNDNVYFMMRNTHYDTIEYIKGMLG